MALDKAGQNIQQQSARALRLAKGPNRNVKSAIQHTSKAASAARSEEAAPQEKVAAEENVVAKLAYAKQARLKDTRKNQEKLSQNLDQAKAYASGALNKASIQIQGLLAMAILDEHPLKLFKKENASAEEAEMSSEEQEAQKDRILESPEDMPFIIRELAAQKIKDEKSKFEDDPEQLAKLEEKEAALAPYSEALDALSGNGSHELAFELVTNKAAGKVSERFKSLYRSYEKSLVNVTKAISHYNELATQHEKTFHSIDGVAPRGDKQARERLYKRPSLLGAKISDRVSGGIRGHGELINIDEATVLLFSADTFSYRDGEHDMEIRNLFTEENYANRLYGGQGGTGYTSVALSEEHPSPSYVYVDSEIAIPDEQIS